MTDLLDDRPDMIGGGAATTANEVDQAVFGEIANGLRGVCRGLVVTGFREWVGESGVGIDVYVGVGYLRKLLEEGAHEVSAEGAVQADAKRLGVADGVPTGFDSLPGQGAAGLVGNGN